MPARNLIRSINSLIINKFLSAGQNIPQEIGSFNNILIVRQHNQFGDMLASVSLFRALKEKYPDSKITLIASPQNFRAVINNPFLDKLFVFDKKKLFNLNYFLELKKILSFKYDLAIVPATVAVSSTSCILVGLSKSKLKIGPKSLEGRENKLSSIFHQAVALAWKKHPDAHVSDFILDVVRPLGITTRNLSSVIPVGEEDYKFADDFIKKIDLHTSQKLIGMHIGAAKPQNRWSLYNYLELIYTLKSVYNCKVFFTCGKADSEELNFMKKNYAETINFWNDTIPQLAAMIDRADLFITNDTGVMHIAGTTTTPQISIFGPTNPYNWAPIGKEKYFLRKSEIINDVTVDDVLGLSKYILKGE